MKPLLLLALLFVSPMAMAAPARKRIMWEYAVVNWGASRWINRTTQVYGAELFLPGGKVNFLEARNHSSPAYRTYLLNRLGAQGWELIAITGPNGSEERYTFKRQK